MNESAFYVLIELAAERDVVSIGDLIAKGDKHGFDEQTIRNMLADAERAGWITVNWDWLMKRADDSR